MWLRLLLLHLARCRLAGRFSDGHLAHLALRWLLLGCLPVGHLVLVLLLLLLFVRETLSAAESLHSLLLLLLLLLLLFRLGRAEPVGLVAIGWVALAGSGMRGLELGIEVFEQISPASQPVIASRFGSLVGQPGPEVEKPQEFRQRR